MLSPALSWTQHPGTPGQTDTEDPYPRITTRESPRNPDPGSLGKGRHGLRVPACSGTVQEGVRPG